MYAGWSDGMGMEMHIPVPSLFWHLTISSVPRTFFEFVFQTKFWFEYGFEGSDRLFCICFFLTNWDDTKRRFQKKKSEAIKDET